MKPRLCRLFLASTVITEISTLNIAAVRLTQEDREIETFARFPGVQLGAMPADAAGWYGFGSAVEPG